MYWPVQFHLRESLYDGLASVITLQTEYSNRGPLLRHLVHSTTVCRAPVQNLLSFPFDIIEYAETGVP